MTRPRRLPRFVVPALGAFALASALTQAFAQSLPPGTPNWPPPQQRNGYTESGVAWRGGQGCWSFAGARAGWIEQVDDLACKYCGDGRVQLPDKGPLWRGDKCFNKFNGWKELLPDSACRYSRREGGCAFLGSYDEDAPFEGVGYDPYPGSGAAIRKGGQCWNFDRGWKELLEDAACRYCGGNASGRDAGPQLRKNQGCWNWNGRSWDGQLSETACKYHGCASSAKAASYVPVLERVSASRSLEELRLRAFLEGAGAETVE